MKIITVLLFSTSILVAGTISGQTIKKYTESASIFDKGPELSNNSYPDSTLFRAYKKGKTGAASLNKLQNQTENKIREFAKKEKKDFVILGQRVSNGPYVFGRYPQVEMVFALTEKKL